MSSTRITTLPLCIVLAVSAAHADPGAWQGSFAYTGGEEQERARTDALQRLRDGDQEKLPFGAAAPRSVEVLVQGATMTIRTDAGSTSGPFDGSLFDARSAAGGEVRVTRSLKEQGGAPVTIVETWKVAQPKVGRSMLKGLVQQTSYALSSDGTTLTVDVKVEGGRLREPATYTLTYRKN